MSLKIVFMGTPEFAVPILKSINDSEHKILEVYTLSPRKKDRGKKIHNTPIHVFSNNNKLKLRFPDKLDSEQECDHLKKLNPDVVVVVAYGKILPTEMLNIDKIKFINIHASLLPKWRGAAPIQRSIMNLDLVTGVSIMQIISKLDAGPVMMQAKLDIKKDTTFEILSKKMSNLAANKIIEALDLIENKNAKFIPQNNKEATYAKKIDKIEAKINWNENANKIIAKINALHLNPGTWFSANGSRVKIIKAIEVNKQGRPGEVLGGNLTIACNENAVQILELKKEGKKVMSASDFLKGNQIEKMLF